MYPVCVVRVCFRMGQSLIQWPQSVHPQARLCTGEHMQYSSVLARFLSALGLSQAACKWKIFSQHQQTQCIFILFFYIYTIALLVTKWDVWYVKSYFRLRGKRDATNDLLYLLFGCILLSPLFHVIRGFGDALGLHSSDTSFPSVAMTRMGLSTKTGADAVWDRHTF